MAAEVAHEVAASLGLDETRPRARSLSVRRWYNKSAAVPSLRRLSAETVVLDVPLWRRWASRLPVEVADLLELLDVRFVSVTSDRRTLRVWRAIDGSDGDLRLSKHPADVVRVCPMPDGRRVVSVDALGTAKAWDCVSGKLLHTLAPMKTSARYSSSIGRPHIAVLDADRVLVKPHMLSAEVLRLLHQSRGQSSDIIKVWNVATGVLEHVTVLVPLDPDLRPWMRTILVVPTPSEQPWGAILVADAGSNIGVWNIQSGQLLRLYADHDVGVSSMCLMPDGVRIASGDAHGRICVWNVRTCTMESSYQLEETPLSGKVLALEPLAPNILASAAFDKSICLWDTTPWPTDEGIDPARRPIRTQPMRQLIGHHRRVYALAALPNAHLASCSVRVGVPIPDFRVWDLSDETRRPYVFEAESPVFTSLPPPKALYHWPARNNNGSVRRPRRQGNPGLRSTSGSLAVPSNADVAGSSRCVVM